MKSVFVNRDHMKKPILFVVDSDVPVLKAIWRDLKKYFGEEFRILYTLSPKEAVAYFGQLKRNEKVLLTLSDHRMPGNDGWLNLLRKHRSNIGRDVSFPYLNEN